MTKRSLLKQRPDSLTSSVSTKHFEVGLGQSSPLSKKRMKLDIAIWPVTTAPPLPDLYLLQKTFIAVSSEFIKDVVNNIVECAVDLNLQGRYDSSNARAVFVIDETEIITQLFLLSPTCNSKSFCIIEFMRVKGSVYIFHNVVIRMLKAVRNQSMCKGYAPEILPTQPVDEAIKVKMIDLEALNELLSKIEL